MAKKKGAGKPPRDMTKRHLALWRRQQRRQRVVFISGVSVIVAVVLIILAGWYLSDYRPMHRTVIKVNDATFDTSYFIDALQVIGSGKTVDDYVSLVSSMIPEIERTELIRQGAKALGITASDNESRAMLVGKGVPVNKATIDLARSQLIQEKLKKEYFEAKVPVSAPQVHIMAIFLESESQAAELRARLLNGDNFTDLAAEYSVSDFIKAKKGDIDWHPREILATLLDSSVPGDFAFGAEAGVLSQPLQDKDKSKLLGYWLIKVLEREAGATEAQVQALLLGSQDEAQGVRDKLLAGGDLAELAKEFSQNGVSQKGGGEMGVVSQEEISPAFDSFVFDTATKVGEWSLPVSDNAVTTKGGSWLVDVLEKAADRVIDSTDRDSLVAKAYSSWVSGLQSDPANKVESYLNTDDYLWVAERAASKK